MAFDQPTRNRLQKFVSDARALLTEEFTWQLQFEYGLNPSTGEVADLDKLTVMDDSKRQTARLLRETLEHYLATNPSSNRQSVIERIVREQAFTVLNRLSALRMAEARGLLIESIGKGYQSKGFQLYARLAGTSLGETGDAYRCYLFSLFDEFAVDLAVLFDRFSPSGRLFPREAALLPLLEQINHPDIDALWAEDETIGWIYQYFNSKDERKKMRDESAAPRNSRELAVRNQFFTPRYVVEFLTDNTLGRIWYEMTQGQTSLKDSCRYLVRRPDEVFLSESTDPNAESAYEECVRLAGLLQGGSVDTWPEFDASGESKTALIAMHMCVDGDLRPKDNWDVCERVLIPQQYTGVSTQDLFDAVYFQGRADRHGGDDDTAYEQPWFIGACNELRRRALESRRTDLSQEEFLKQPVFIPHRPLKDPRDIKMLDPACGSMHFGLYAFDLFERIYAEAWELEDEEKCTQFNRSKGLLPLRETYATHEAFLLDVPRLIIEHNIHGIDIDPRAVQIAGLSLWLRAQKSWQAQGVKPQARPQIRRSNIACAEPMPGEAAFLEEFIAQHLSGDPERQFLAGLVRKVFDSMKLAGEAGSLLKIEEEIADEVAKAKRQWLERPALKQRMLFAAAPKREQKELDLTRGIADASFWDDAEKLLYDALRAYSEQAEQSGGYQRRLFADDAARGFAFIDVCRSRYDVALMNPPFGDAIVDARDYLSVNYVNAKHDLAAAFIDRANGLLQRRCGVTGCITTRTLFFLPTSDKWRHALFADQAVAVFADLGLDVMDAAIVYAAAYILTSTKPNKTVFIRATDASDKPSELLRALDHYGAGKCNANTFLRNVDVYKDLPGWVVPYYLPESLTGVFTRFARFGTAEPGAKQGIATSDDFRFVRGAWEIPPDEIGSQWRWHTKGGSYSPFYVDVEFVLQWENDGAEVKAFAEKLTLERFGSPSWSRWINAVDYYFEAGLTFTYRSKRFAVAAMPRGVVFGVTGMGVFVSGEDRDTLEAMALMNSSPFNFFLLMLCERKDPLFQAGKINSVPWPRKQRSPTLERLADSGFRDSLRYHSLSETSPYFTWPFITLASNIGTLTELDASERCHRMMLIDNWKKRQRDIDRCVSELYGIDEASFSQLRGELAIAVGDSDHDLLGAPALRSQQENAGDLLSFCMGCSFGRYECIENEIGRQNSVETATPFDVPFKHSYFDRRVDVGADWGTGMASDDPGHPLDIEVRVQQVLKIIWPDRCEAIEHEACEMLGVKTLREYFRKPALFFADHLQRYSKSRRQAPIYWPLATASGSYTLWVYYHRLTDQTLYTAVNDFVEPKLKQATDDAARLRQKTGRNNAEEKELEQLTDLEQELKDFRDELLRLAKFWKPNLNDGVQITAAPLWKLFRLSKWQKTLKQTWQELEAGDYDWAHLAHSIWSDRVAEKCKTDKSLAIAHNLEHLYIEVPKPTKKRATKKKKVEDEDELEDG